MIPGCSVSRVHTDSHWSPWTPSLSVLPCRRHDRLHRRGRWLITNASAGLARICCLQVERAPGRISYSVHSAHCATRRHPLLSPFAPSTSCTAGSTSP